MVQDQGSSIGANSRVNQEKVKFEREVNKVILFRLKVITTVGIRRKGSNVQGPRLIYS